MTRDLLLRGIAYLIAGTVTEIVLFVCSLIYTDPIASAAITAEVVIVVGIPTLRAVEIVTRHLGGRP